MAFSRLFPSSPLRDYLFLLALILACSTISSSIASSSNGAQNLAINDGAFSSDTLSARFRRSGASNSADSSAFASSNTITTTYAIYLETGSSTAWSGDCASTTCTFSSPCSIASAQSISYSLTTTAGQSFDCTLVWLSTSNLNTVLTVIPAVVGTNTFLVTLQNLYVFYAGLSTTAIVLPPGSRDPGTVIPPPEDVATPGITSAPVYSGPITVATNPLESPVKPAAMGVPPNAKRQETLTSSSQLGLHKSDSMMASASSASRLRQHRYNLRHESARVVDPLRWDGRSGASSSTTQVSSSMASSSMTSSSMASSSMASSSMASSSMASPSSSSTLLRHSSQKSASFTPSASGAASLIPPSLSVTASSISTYFYNYDYVAQGNGDVNSPPEVSALASLAFRSTINRGTNLAIDGITFAPQSTAFQSPGIGLVNVSTTNTGKLAVNLKVTNCLFSLPSQLSAATSSLIFNPTVGASLVMTNNTIRLATATAQLASASPLFITNLGSATFNNLTSTVYSTLCADCSSVTIASSYLEIGTILSKAPSSQTIVAISIATSTLNGFNFTGSDSVLFNDLLTIASGTEGFIGSVSMTIQGSFLSGFRYQSSIPITSTWTLISSTISASPMFNVTNASLQISGLTLFSNASSLILASSSGFASNLIIAPDSQVSFYGTVSFDTNSKLTAMNISLSGSNALVKFGSLDMTSSSFSPSTYPGVASQQSSLTGPRDGTTGTISSSAVTANTLVWSLSSMSISNVVIDMSFVNTLNYRDTRQSTAKVAYGLVCTLPSSDVCFTALPSKMQVIFTPVANVSAVAGNQLIAKVAYDSSDKTAALPIALGPWSLGLASTPGASTYQSLYFYDPSSIAPPPVYIPPICGVGSFSCNTTTGVVTSNVSVTIPTLVITTGVTTVQITGNLTVESALVFKDSSATVSVTGCANVTSVTIDVTSGTSASTQSLITQAGENCEPLTSIPVHIVDNSKNCKKTSVSTTSSTASTLSVFFSYDNSGCNTKWIILGAVLGGVIVLTVIVLILVFTFSESARECVRPYSKKRATTAPRTPTI